MEDLIKALQILNKYGNPMCPIICCHDELIINGISPEIISEEDKYELSELGFIVYIQCVYQEDNDLTPDESKIFSFRFGSA